MRGVDIKGMHAPLKTYNSNAGNGLLGVDFSLSRLSAIPRRNLSIARDGMKGSAITNPGEKT